MTDNNLGKQKKALHTLAMVNTGIWAIALVALVILLEGHGNLRGMYVILATGVAVAIQLIAVIAKLEQ